MYRFSRAIYLELAPAVESGPDDPDGSRARQRLLRASEETIERMAADRHFARPWRSLFIRIRFDFSLVDQQYVAELLERHLRLARRTLEQWRLETNFQPHQCRGISRAGDPCRRTPKPGNEFCPSHYHLGELWDGAEDPGQAADSEGREAVLATASAA